MSRKPISLKTLQNRLFNLFRPGEIFKLARQSGFYQRKHRKIHPKAFLKTCCFFAIQPKNSLRNMSALLTLLAGKSVSKQALAKRVSMASVLFFKEVLQTVISRSSQFKKNIPQDSFASFKRILLHDNTTLPLHPKFEKVFPGSKNQTHKPLAIIKIQTVYELISESFVSLC